MPDRERKRVPDDRSDILKGSLPKSPAHHWDTENPSIWSWTKRTRRRIEMKQLGEVWRSCTRDNVEAGESYFVLNPAADRQLMEIKEKRSNVSRFRSFVDETSWAVIHSLDFIKKNLRRASKESIAIIKPRENTRGNARFSSFHRKILWDWTDPPNLQISQLTEFVHLFLQCELTVKNDTEITSCTGKEMSLWPTRTEEGRSIPGAEPMRTISVLSTEEQESPNQGK